MYFRHVYVTFCLRRFYSITKLYVQNVPQYMCWVVTNLLMYSVVYCVFIGYVEH